MNTAINPTEIAPPAANYSHAMAVPSGHRWLFTSGVVPTERDGRVPTTLSAQAATVWSNLRAMLTANGMSERDVVSVTTYVVLGQDTTVVMAARDQAMNGHRPASTLVFVPALARSEWLMEVALVAARADGT